jgi:glycosyltransferase involved in cell wall biosynthesis
MRLLFLSERFPPEIGGLASSAWRISRAIAGAGHDVHVLSLSSQLAPGEGEMVLPEHRLTLHRYGFQEDAATLYEELAERLRWLHRRHRFDAIWGHSLNRVGFLSVWLAREFGLPSLLALRGDDLDACFFPPGDFARMEWCLRQATRVLVVSRDLAAKVRAITGSEPIYLPNAVDTDTFQPGPPPTDLVLRYGLDGGPLVLGFSGELRASKGMSQLLEAFRAVWGVRAARLLVIGDIHPGELSDFLIQTDQPTSLGRDIRRTGHLTETEDVARHLRLCDVLLVPSLREGMPNSLLEGLACGSLVLASAVGGIPDVIRDGHNGILVPRSGLGHLGERILALVQEPAERLQALREAGRATVLERYHLGQERLALAEVIGGLDRA